MIFYLIIDWFLKNLNLLIITTFKIKSFILEIMEEENKAIHTTAKKFLGALKDLQKKK